MLSIFGKKDKDDAQQEDASSNEPQGAIGSDIEKYLDSFAHGANGSNGDYFYSTDSMGMASMDTMIGNITLDMDSIVFGTSASTGSGSLSVGTITLPSGNGYYSPNGVYTTGGTNNMWSIGGPAANDTHGTLRVSGDADFAGDVRIGGVSVLETIRAIQDRLSILVPDPDKLEKYEALKQAYEHYKTLEALCMEEVKPLDAP